MKVEIKSQRVNGGWAEIVTDTYEVDEIVEKEEGKRILYLRKTQETKIEYPLPGC